ncbi:hypothetical protein Tco_1146768 [Tanacetum coccineum]
MTNPTITEDSLKYPERVHVTTDYLVEGSDKMQFGTISGEEEFLYQIESSKRFVETNEGRITVSNVLFTPEITLNILSLDQLEEQGYMEAKRSRHGEPGDVAVNCRGTAGKEIPQADARIDAEVEEMLYELSQERGRLKRKFKHGRCQQCRQLEVNNFPEKEAGTSTVMILIINT